MRGAAQAPFLLLVAAGRSAAAVAGSIKRFKVEMGGGGKGARSYGWHVNPHSSVAPVTRYHLPVIPFPPLCTWVMMENHSLRLLREKASGELLFERHAFRPPHGSPRTLHCSGATQHFSPAAAHRKSRVTYPAPVASEPADDTAAVGERARKAAA